MDKYKILKLIVNNEKNCEEPKKGNSHTFVSNPILERMIKVNSESKKYKFSFKDLFR